MSKSAISPSHQSAFGIDGFQETISDLTKAIQQIYRADNFPWVIGYSGGKDSTAVLQLVWNAISDLEPNERTKPVHVITTDTLVENPVVASWVSKSLATMKEAAREEGLPVYPALLTPNLADTFWVNLIGRGYPAPRPKFRWCTERLKIKPADAFITNVAQQSGEAILVLGTRRAESSVRSGRMKEAEAREVRKGLSPSSTLPNTLIYSPIEDWSNDDVWLYLMQVKNPWGYNNKDLLTMYQGASPDGECPLVLDTSTPSCGDSRFGCWVCTLVDKDKSMTAMIQNDAEKSWMRPLLELRNDLDEHDHGKRDFRRLAGQVQLITNTDRLIPGPYTQDARAEWLRRLLMAQQAVRMDPLTPEHVRDIELIAIEELHEIRRMWVVEKHEVEDLLPEIFESITGAEFPKRPLNDSQPFGREEMKILKDVCRDDDLLFELTRDLLEIERGYRASAKRAKLFEKIDRAVRKSFYVDPGDAQARAVHRKKLKDYLVDIEAGSDEARESLQKELNLASDNQLTQGEAR